MGGDKEVLLIATYFVVNVGGGDVVEVADADGGVGRVVDGIGYFVSLSCPDGVGASHFASYMAACLPETFVGGVFQIADVVFFESVAFKVVVEDSYCVAGDDNIGEYGDVVFAFVLDFFLADDGVFGESDYAVFEACKFVFVPEVAVGVTLHEFIKHRSGIKFAAFVKAKFLQADDVGIYRIYFGEYFLEVALCTEYVHVVGEDGEGGFVFGFVGFGRNGYLIIKIGKECA